MSISGGQIISGTSDLQSLFSQLLDASWPFHHLSQDARAEAVQRLEAVRFLPGDVLLRQGDTAQHLFVVLAGRLHLCRSTTLVDGSSGPSSIVELQCGDAFGAYPKQMPQRGTVLCLTPCICLRLPVEESFTFEVQTPGEKADLSSRDSKAVDIVRHLWVCGHWADLAKEQLTNQVQLFQCERGTVLQAQGQPQDALLTLVQGTVEVLRSTNHAPPRRVGLVHTEGLVNPGALTEPALPSRHRAEVLSARAIVLKMPTARHFVCGAFQEKLSHLDTTPLGGAYQQAVEMEPEARDVPQAPPPDIAALVRTSVCGEEAADKDERYTEGSSLGGQSGGTAMFEISFKNIGQLSPRAQLVALDASKVGALRQPSRTKKKKKTTASHPAQPAQAHVVSLEVPIPAPPQPLGPPPPPKQSTPLQRTGWPGSDVRTPETDFMRRTPSHSGVPPRELLYRPDTMSRGSLGEALLSRERLSRGGMSREGFSRGGTSSLSTPLSSTWGGLSRPSSSLQMQTHPQVSSTPSRTHSVATMRTSSPLPATPSTAPSTAMGSPALQPWEGPPRAHSVASTSHQSRASTDIMIMAEQAATRGRAAHGRALSGLSGGYKLRPEPQGRGSSMGSIKTAGGFRDTSKPMHGNRQCVTASVTNANTTLPPAPTPKMGLSGCQHRMRVGHSTWNDPLIRPSREQKSLWFEHNGSCLQPPRHPKSPGLDAALARMGIVAAAEVHALRKGEVHTLLQAPNALSSRGSSSVARRQRLERRREAEHRILFQHSPPASKVSKTMKPVATATSKT